MPSKKKRIEALAELYNSEKSYIQDIKLWHIGLRTKLLKLTKISPQTKFNICDSIFINIGEIYRFHRRIFEEMHKKNIEILKKYPKEYEQYKSKIERLKKERIEKQGQMSSHNRENNGSDKVDLLEILRKQGGNIVNPRYPTSAEDISMESSEMDDWEFELKKDGSMDTSSLEYATVFQKVFSGFKKYEEYVAWLPKSEYEFERSNSRSSGFNKVIKDFQIEYKVEHIGTKHFFYRPSGKLARYPLLLKAILKNETDESFARQYRELIEQFKTFTTKIDRMFKISSEFFTMFLLSNMLRYTEEVENTQFVGLIFRDIKLIKTGKIILKSGRGMPATYRQIYIFNRAIVFCKSADNLFDEIDISEAPIFLHGLTAIRRHTDRFGKDEKTDAFYPIYLMQSSLGIERMIYFEDESTRDLYYFMIRGAIRRINRKVSTGHALSLQTRLSDDRILCVCTSQTATVSLQNVPTELQLDFSIGEAVSGAGTSEVGGEETGDYYVRELHNHLNTNSDENSSQGDLTSMSWEEYDRQKKDMNKTHRKRNVEDGEGLIQNEERSSTSEDNNENNVYGEESIWNIGRYFKRSSFYFSKLVFEKPVVTDDESYSRDQESMLLYSTPMGIYRRIGSSIVLVSAMYATKLIYDKHAELLFYLSDSYVYVSKFNCRSMALEDKQIDITASDVLYGVLDDEVYLTLISNRNFGFSVIYVLNLVEKEEVYSISLSRKLYVGFFISCVSYMRNRIVIGCKDFEIVEVNTLRTQNLLEYSDPFTSALACTIKESVAKQIFRIEESTYLLCFDRIGFYIDSIGYYKYSHITFNWECQAHSFKIYQKNILVLSKTRISVFSLETGKSIYYKEHPWLRFVDNTNEPLLYDKHFIYRYYDDTEDRDGGGEDSMKIFEGVKNREGSSETESSAMTVSDILDLVSSEDSVIKILKEVEKQKTNVLNLKCKSKKVRGDTKSDDTCLQSYSMKQESRGKKKRRPCTSESPMFKEDPNSAPKKALKRALQKNEYNRRGRHKNLLALSKISLQREKEPQYRVNINKEVSLGELKGFTGTKPQEKERISKMLSSFDSEMRNRKDSQFEVEGALNTWLQANHIEKIESILDEYEK
ncbi:hypothetical protein PAEPH01_0278 [Pancytospora epiphaga]|nr:hypothetical protein PAEPH01_0278 [Pancytospora epiphaga]